MNGFRQDLQYAARVLIKSPTFTFIAAITLALGIGVNATVFSIANAYLFRPLPVRAPGELMAVASKNPSIEVPYQVSYLDYADIRDRAGAFSEAIGFGNAPVNMSTTGKSERVWLDAVTGNYFSMLGVDAFAGRTFSAEEGRIPGGSQVLVLTYGFWKSRFGGDYSVIGQSIKLDGKPFTIIGITAKGFTGTDLIIECDGYVPFASVLESYGGPTALTDRNATCLNVLGRLKSGVRPGQAQQALEVLSGQLSQEYPKTNTGISFMTVPEPESRPIIGISRVFGQASMIFLALVGLIMLIACINVISLMLARASARQKELAIRGALGASRSRLIRLFIIESMMVSILGGVLGLVLGIWASSLVSGIRLTGAPVQFNLGVDWRVFAFTLVVVVGAGLLSGLLPALGSSRPDLNETLKEGARGNVGGRGWQRLRSALVVAQIAVSLLLLISAGLFLRSLQAAEHSDLGFRSRDVLMGSFDLGLQGYDEARSRGFEQKLLDRLKEIPGVRRASISANAPFSTTTNASNIITEESAQTADKGSDLVFFNDISSGYLDTYGVTIVEGRGFTDQDTSTSPKVAVVSQAMARHFWPGQDAIGKRFKTDSQSPLWQVVGVTRDEKHLFIGEDPRPFAYFPLTQDFHSGVVASLYSTSDPASLKMALAGAVHDLDADLPLFDIETMPDHLNNGIAFLFVRIGAAFAGVFGLLALVLATVGIYGTVSYSVNRRTREIGIRMAMGAARSQVLGMVFRQGALLVAGGLAIGLPLAFAGTRLLSSLLYGISANDAVTFVAVSVILALVAFVASFMPARRAATVDPMVALRYE
jgi:putative ABC transport system permease protein